MAERVYVDRIEGERAVLLFGPEGREAGTVPARCLPPGTREGAALDFALSPAPEDQTQEAIREQMEELFDGQG